MHSKGSTLDEIYLFWLEKTFKSIRKATAKFFKELNVDLTVDQWTLLKRLDERGTLTQKQLADCTFKDPASITRTLDLLEKRGLIERKPAEKDRRLYIITNTSKGQELVDHILSNALEFRNRGIKGLDEDDLKGLEKALKTIQNNLDHY